MNGSYCKDPTKVAVQTCVCVSMCVRASAWVCVSAWLGSLKVPVRHEACGK